MRPYTACSASSGDLPLKRLPQSSFMACWNSAKVMVRAPLVLWQGETKRKVTSPLGGSRMGNSQGCPSRKSLPASCLSFLPPGCAAHHASLWHSLDFVEYDVNVSAGHGFPIHHATLFAHLGEVFPSHVVATGRCVTIHCKFTESIFYLWHLAAVEKRSWQGRSWGPSAAAEHTCPTHLVSRIARGTTHRYLSTMGQPLWPHRYWQRTPGIQAGSGRDRLGPEARQRRGGGRTLGWINDCCMWRNKASKASEPFWNTSFS